MTSNDSIIAIRQYNSQHFSNVFIRNCRSCNFNYDNYLDIKPSDIRRTGQDGHLPRCRWLPAQYPIPNFRAPACTPWHSLCFLFSFFTRQGSNISHYGIACARKKKSWPRGFHLISLMGRYWIKELFIIILHLLGFQKFVQFCSDFENSSFRRNVTLLFNFRQR